MKGENHSDYVLPINIDLKYAGETLSITKGGNEMINESKQLQVLSTDLEEEQTGKQV